MTLHAYFNLNFSKIWIMITRFGTRFLLKRLSDRYYNMQPQTGCTISENNGYDHLFSSSLIDFCNLFEHSAIETFFAHLLAFICECIFSFLQFQLLFLYHIFLVLFTPIMISVAQPF